MKIHEVAKLSGVTVRTLHYYDEIGLLKPSTNTDNGYRVYTEKHLETLQEILFFRELDFPLADIKAIMGNPRYDKSAALKSHKEILTKKRDRLNNLIRLCEDTMKGALDMSFTQFDTSAIDEMTKATKEKYGNTQEYAESIERTKGYTTADWDSINAKANALFAKFASHRHLPPSDPQVQEIVAQWQKYITDHFYHCTNEILGCLGQTYLEEDFTKNIDQAGEGTARFMSEAIKVYCA